MIPSLSPLLILLAVPFLAMGAIIAGFPALRTAGVASAFNAVLAFSLCVVTARQPVNLSLLEMNFNYCEVTGWPSIHCHLTMTGLSSLLLVVTTLIGFAAIAKIPERADHPSLYACALLILNGAAIGTILAQDVFELIFYLALFVMPPFLVIGRWGGHNRQLGGFQTTLTWGLGIGLIFAAILGMASMIPDSFTSYEWATIRDSASALSSQKQVLLFGLLLAGTGLLIGVVPTHGWVLAGYSAAPGSLAMFIAGVLPCLAFYILVEWGIHLLPLGYSRCQSWILAMGVTNLLYAGILSWELREIRQVIGAVCLCQRGLIFLGLSVPSELAQAGAFLLMMGSALSAACLVGLLAELEHIAGDNRIRELSSKFIPSSRLFNGTLLCATGAAIGFPLSINFIGIYLVLEEITRGIGPVLLLATLFGICLFGSGLIQTLRIVFFRGATTVAADEQEAFPISPFPSAREFLPYGLLLLLNLLAGCDPGLLLRVLDWGRLSTP